MGIFSRKDKKAENAVQVGDVMQTPNILCGWDAFGWNPRKKGFKPFGKIFLQMALNQIYNGISNVSFESLKDNYVANGICSFLDNNAAIFVNQWLNAGFLAVQYDKDYNYKILGVNDLKYDQYRRVINKNAVVVYSPHYQVAKTGYMQTLLPEIGLIDTLANTLSESCGTMGVLPIISGNAIPANPTFKDELAQSMSKDYGWGEDQLKYFLSKAELKVDSIDLKVKDLEIGKNLMDAFKVLLNYLEVPVDLIIGNSTYSNVESAKVFFYENCVKKYAEAILKLGRNLLTASNTMLPQNTITYHITNVSGLDKTLSDRCKERGAYIDLLLKLKENGVDVSAEIERVYKDVKKDYLEV